VELFTRESPRQEHERMSNRLGKWFAPLALFLAELVDSLVLAGTSRVLRFPKLIETVSLLVDPIGAHHDIDVSGEAYAYGSN